MDHVRFIILTILVGIINLLQKDLLSVLQVFKHCIDVQRGFRLILTAKLALLIVEVFLASREGRHLFLGRL